MEFFEDFRDLAERGRFLQAELKERETISVSNPVCGDKIFVQVDLEGQRIKSLGYQAHGCWPVFSCLEFLGQKFVGQTIESVLSYRMEEFLSEIGCVPASKRHAFSLSLRGRVQAVTKSCALRAEYATSPVGREDQERV